MKQNYRNPQADAWFRGIIDDPAAFPFSFTYNGEQYKGFSPGQFTLLSREVTYADDKEDAVLCFRKDDTLTATVYCTHHFTHGSTEWKVVFANDGSADSGICSGGSRSVCTCSSTRSAGGRRRICCPFDPESEQKVII